MLIDIGVLNGILDKDFSVDEYVYRVNPVGEIKALAFTYNVPQDAKINIVGNEKFAPGDNYVFFEIVSNDILTTYTFIVNKEMENQAVMLPDDDAVELEVTGNSVPFDPTIYIMIVCSLLIVIFYKIIFNKKA